MRAMLSDREQRADSATFDAMPRPIRETSQFHANAGFQCEDIWALAAQCEALALMEATEPAHGWNDCAWPEVGHFSTVEELNGTGRILPLQAGIALAESLAAFIAS